MDVNGSILKLGPMDPMQRSTSQGQPKGQSPKSKLYSALALTKSIPQTRKINTNLEFDFVTKFFRSKKKLLVKYTN